MFLALPIPLGHVRGKDAPGNVDDRAQVTRQSATDSRIGLTFDAREQDYTLRMFSSTPQRGWR